MLLYWFLWILPNVLSRVERYQRSIVSVYPSVHIHLSNHQTDLDQIWRDGEKI